MKQLRIRLTFRPVSSGRRLLVIQPEGAPCSPHTVRECLERGVEAESPLVFGIEGTNGVRLYEPVPSDWSTMLVTIQQLLQGQFKGAEIVMPEQLPTP